MASEQNREQLFSRELDNLLAGQPLITEESMDPDVRSALDFAAKIRAIRRRPNPAFGSQLKSRLLRMLAERPQPPPPRQTPPSPPRQTVQPPPRRPAPPPPRQPTPPPVRPSTPTQPAQPAGAKEGGLNKLLHTFLSKGPLWQAGAFLVVFVVIMATTWSVFHFIQNPPFAGDGGEPTSNVSIKAEASTNKARFAPGEIVTIKVRLTNSSSQTLQIEWFPKVSLMQTGTQSPVYVFMETNDNFALKPRTVAVSTLSWNQTDFKGVQVPAGSYYLELGDLDIQGKSQKLSLAQPVIFSITAPSK